MKLFWLLALAVAVCHAAPPIITASGWRHISFNVGAQPIGMTVFSVTFDQDLYIDASGTGSLTKVADLRSAIGQWPTIAYRMQGSMNISCGTKIANRYSTLDSAPNYIMFVPPTVDPVATFFGYFAGFFLQAAKSYNTLEFIILHDLSGISKAELDTCLAAGLQVEFFPSQCIPTAAELMAVQQTWLNMNGQNQPPGQPPLTLADAPYNTSDLLCGVSNAAGEKIVNQMYTMPTTATALECTISGVQQLQADLIQMRNEFKQISGQQALNGISFAELAMTTRLSFQGCQDILNQVIQFQTITRSIGDSQDCPDRTNTSSPAYLSNPCCNYRQGRCCIPQPVTQTFQAPANVLYTALQGICPNAANDPVIRGLLAIFAINLQRELTAPPPPDVNVLYQNLFQNVWNECQGGLYSSCTNNAQCYSRNCDTRQSRCLPSKEGDALPMIRCLVEKYNGGSGTMTAAFQVFAGIDTALTDPEVVAQGIYASLLAAHAVEDCVGDQSRQFRSQLQYIRNPQTGVWERSIVPANRAGCLSVQRCNWNPWAYPALNASQCANDGPSTHFCGLCASGYCQDLTRFPVCRFSWQVSQSATPADCTTLGGVMEKTSNYAYSAECIRKSLSSIPGDINSCLDSICPGPNSPDQWIKDLFTQTGPHTYNYACDAPLCYATSLDMAACNALRNTMWTNRAACEGAATTQAETEACQPWYVNWDMNYKDGAGLCVRYLWNTPSPMVATGMAICTAMTNTFTYYAGASYQGGEFYTQALCENANICELRNQPPLTVATAADCTSMSSCDFSCPACVQTLIDSPVCATDLNQTTCSERKQGNPQWDSGTMKCLVEVKDAAACSALPGGMMASCRPYNETACGTSAVPYQTILGCQYQYWAPCLDQASCQMQGECDDYELQSSGVCVYPFQRDPMNKPIIRCGVPIVEGYPCENCAGSTEDQYRWGKIGCIKNNQQATPNKATCEASVAPYDATLNGMWMTRATNEVQCTGRAQGCRRFGSWLTRIEQQECNECNGKFEALYTWRKGRMVPGRLLTLKWMPRQSLSQNAMVTTLSVADLQIALEGVVSKFLGSGFGNSMTQNYAFRFSLYERIIKRCTNSNETIGAVGGLVGTCECFGGGKPCEGFCPIECPFPCEYDAINYIAFAIGSSIRRRMMGITSPYEIIKDGSGAVVGVYVGDALQLNVSGSGQSGLTGIQRICVSDNVQYTGNVSAKYTVYDFAPTIPGGAPGIPMGISVVREGTKTCGNITLGNFGVYPIKRLANFQSGTSAPSMRPSAAPVKGSGVAGTMSPTKAGNGTDTAGSGHRIGANTIWVFGMTLAATIFLAKGQF